ncbi:hypothetical protein [uncultured Thiodictyon sp.]|uniref:ParB/RepB/Spo0J family partition protein n=1 Tax=uncultured Thiodictyon sp. TaxID=1846217 RepID=UPI0025E84DF3|nr:hypothetical protein [uncultured Thiodictyon sp.]
MIGETRVDIEHRAQGGGGGDRPDQDPLDWAEVALRQIEDERGRNPGYTQRDVAQRLGVNYTTLSHGLRMVRRLRAPAREALRRGDLTLGHGKALAAIAGAEQDAMVELLVQRGASVRTAEEVAASRNGRGGRVLGFDPMRLEERISAVVGAPALIECRQNQQRGRIILTFADRNALEAILGRLGIERS